MGQAKMQPARWKMWLLSTVGIYPVLMVLVTGVNAVGPAWPIAVRLAVVAPAAVACMVWVIAPLQQRLIARWT